MCHIEPIYFLEAANDDHPPHDVLRGQAFLSTILHALAEGPQWERSLVIITYDEHGGFYDHVPPPTGVPSPGDPAGRLGKLFEFFLHRRADAFDFTTLGVRVPAIAISPHVAAGRVDDTVRDHAAVPATLRALFAPKAKPLTRRDAWSPTFHHVVDLPEPRRGDQLPDLSAYTTGAQRRVVAEPGVTSKAAAATEVPAVETTFIAQAERVREHLLAVGEPEVTTGEDHLSPTERGADITQVFLAAAKRHRAELREPHGVPAGSVVMP